MSSVTSNIINSLEVTNSSSLTLDDRNLTQNKINPKVDVSIQGMTLHMKCSDYEKVVTIDPCMIDRAELVVRKCIGLSKGDLKKLFREFHNQDCGNKPRSINRFVALFYAWHQAKSTSAVNLSPKFIEAQIKVCQKILHTLHQQRKEHSKAATSEYACFTKGTDATPHHHPTKLTCVLDFKNLEDAKRNFRAIMPYSIDANWAKTRKDEFTSLNNVKKKLKKNLLDSLHYSTNGDLANNQMDVGRLMLFSYKYHSYNRFVSLFKIHMGFANRLRQGLKMIPNIEDRKNALEIIQRKMSPEMTLEETTEHRSLQGRHGGTHKDRLKNHAELLGSDVECQHSHVIPFPAIFQRNWLKEIPGISDIGSLSLNYSEANAEEKIRMVARDMNSIFQKHKENIEFYSDNLLNLCLNLAANESSSTFHLPAIFNQELDRTSEKYIKLGAEGKNYLSKEEYKYILANDLHRLISSDSSSAVDLKTILEEYQDYIVAVKRTIAERIVFICGQESSIGNKMIALSLINIFFQLKNVEAKAGLDDVLRSGDDEVFRAASKIDGWLKITATMA